MTFPHPIGNSAAFPASVPSVPENTAPLSKAKPGIPAALPVQSVILEGEDARLNGMTRSLHRRLIGLNLPPQSAAGAQGSTDLPSAA